MSTNSNRADSSRNRLTDTRRRAVDRLLVAYLERDEADQAEFLAECRQRWPRLARWLSELVSSGHTLSVFEQPLHRLAADAAGSRQTEAAPRLTAGEELGPWKIIEPIAAGGMGVVYRGERADGAFEMAVAVKLLGRRGAGLAEQLQRESRLLARLNHPSITRVLDAGLDAQAGPFLVMEWIEGRDLSEWVQDRPLRDERLSVFSTICRAVAHAHQHLIVHGDIKPGNVRIDEGGQVKLMDFGVARLAEGDNSGEWRGFTPTFAAPEQLRGEPLSPLSDVWALGALLAWMTTGEVPGRQTTEAPAGSPSTGDRELEAIVAKACAGDPDQRYRSVDDLAADLERHVRKRPVHAMPSSACYRAGRFIRRNPVLIGGVSATAAAVLIGLVTSTGYYLEAEQARQAAERQAAELEQVVEFQQSQLAELDTAGMGAQLRASTLEELETSLAEQAEGKFDTAGLVDGMDFTGLALDLLDDYLFEPSLIAIDEQFTDQRRVRARLLATIAVTLERLGRYGRAREIQKLALALRREHLGEHHPDTLESRHRLGVIDWRQGRMEAATAQVRDILALRRKHLGSAHADTLASHVALGAILTHRSQFDEAAQHIQRALDGYAADPDKAPRSHLVAKQEYGLLLKDRGEFERAERYMREALEGQRELLGPTHTETLTTLNNLGHILSTAGRYVQAAEIYREAVELRTERHGEMHPETLRSLNNLGYSIQRLGEIDKAEALFRRALAGRKQLFGINHPDTQVSMATLADVLKEQGQLEAAESLTRELLEATIKTLGPTHWRTFIVYNNLGDVLRRQGRLEEAHEASLKAWQDASEHLGDDNWRTAICRRGYANALLAQGRPDEAGRHAAAAHEAFKEILGPDHPHTRQTSKLLSTIEQQREQSRQGETIAADSRET